MEDNKQARKTEKAKYDIAYAKNNIKRVPLDMQKSDYEELKAAAGARGEKVNEYIKTAIRERMARDKLSNCEEGDSSGIWDGSSEVKSNKLCDLP